jgi:hypothetical protein
MYWEEHSKIFASDAQSNADFGMSVGIDSNLLVVGAHNHNDTGAVYVFRNTNGDWVEEAKLVPSKGKSGDIFGWKVDISDNKIIVGAESSDTVGENSGIAYIYEYIEDKWKETAILVPVEVEAGDKFGSSVAIQDSIAIVGSEWDVKDGNMREGSVYYYKKDESQWSKKMKLDSPFPNAYNYFGSSVSIGDSLVIIGASGAVNDFTSLASGVAYIYKIDSDQLVYQSKLFSQNGIDYDRYSDNVATDGISFIIGAVDVDSADISSTGEVYIYHELWLKNIYLTPPYVKAIAF